MKQQGIYSIKIVSGNRGGLPDIVACVNGKFVAFEIKRDGAKLTALQACNREQIEQAGGKFFIANNLQDIVQILREI